MTEEKLMLHTSLKKKPMGQPRELQTCQSHFDPWENHKTSPLGNTSGHESNWE